MKKWANLILASACVMSFSSQAAWHYGSSTGIKHYTIDTDIRFQNSNLDTLVFSSELDTSEASQYAKSALGIDGYGSNGKWRFDYLISQYEVTQDRTASNVFAHEQSQQVMQLTAGKAVAKHTGSKRLYLNGGFRYTDFDYQVASDAVRYRHNESWLDVVAGIKFDMPLTRELILHANADIAFGSADTSHTASLALNYRINKSLSVMVKGEYMDLEYENKSLNSLDKNDNPNWFDISTSGGSIGLQVVKIW